MTDFPYVRLICCELCGRAVAEPELRRVELEPAVKVKGNVRAARAIHLCRDHAEDEPPRTPRAMTMAGTSKHRPQEERLF
jgi:hypothetical protein